MFCVRESILHLTLCNRLIYGKTILGMDHLLCKYQAKTSLITLFYHNIFFLKQNQIIVAVINAEERRCHKNYNSTKYMVSMWYLWYSCQTLVRA